MDSHVSHFVPSSEGRHYSRNGFSFVELIVVVTILAILSVVAVTYGNNYKLSQYNVRRIDDIKTLQNAMDSFVLAKKTMPEAVANTQFYDIKGNYVHNGAPGAFGASSFVTPDTFPREYLQTFPLDPQTNHYYAYGRRYDGTLGYEFATVINDGGQYSTYLRGSYDGTKLISLIKEYNGPNFVDDGTVDYLPYNPEELKVTGHIISWSGTLTLNNIPFTDPKQLLGQGDTINVSTGGLAKISLSDGSELELGSISSASELRFDTLKYNEDNNLSTQVESVLTMGEVWVRAPKYYHTSNFQIAADGQAATVRGTVFGVSKLGTTHIQLADGIISVSPKDATNTQLSLGTLPTGFETDDATKAITMTVPEGSGGLDLGFTCYSNPSNPCSPKSISGSIADPSLQQKMNTITTEDIGVHSGRIPEILELTMSGSGTNKQLIIKLANFGANEIEVTASGQTSTGSVSTASGIITFSSSDSKITNTSDLTIRLIYDPSQDGKNGEVRYSAPKNITLPSSDASFSFSGVSLETPTPSDNTCASGSVNWGTLGCQDTSLVAYAKYDNINDTTGDADATFGLHTARGRDLIHADTTLTYTGRTSFESCISTGQGVSQCNIPYVPVPTSNPWTLSGTFLDGSSDTGSTGSGLTTYDTETLVQRAGFLQSLGFQINPWNDIWRLPDGTTGAYIDNYGSGDYLKYDLTPIADQLGDKFAIEIGVRGAALKRMTPAYYLFTLSDNSSTFNQNSIGFGLNSSGLQSVASGSFTMTPFVSQSSLNSFITDLNMFYRVKISIKKSSNLAQVCIEENCSTWNNINGYMSSNFALAPIISIGSASNNSYQWNDIIDSVKIYNN